MSGSVSVIPYDLNLYNLLKDSNNLESEAIFNLIFKVGGHSNSFVLFSKDYNFSNKFNESIAKENSTKITCVSYYLQNKNKHDFLNEIIAINNTHESTTIKTKKDITCIVVN